MKTRIHRTRTILLQTRKTPRYTRLISAFRALDTVLNAQLARRRGRGGASGSRGGSLVDLDAQLRKSVGVIAGRGFSDDTLSRILSVAPEFYTHQIRCAKPRDCEEEAGALRHFRALSFRHRPASAGRRGGGSSVTLLETELRARESIFRARLVNLTGQAHKRWLEQKGKRWKIAGEWHYAFPLDGAGAKALEPACLPVVPDAAAQKKQRQMAILKDIVSSASASKQPDADGTRPLAHICTRSGYWDRPLSHTNLKPPPRRHWPQHAP